MASIVVIISIIIISRRNYY